MALNNTVELSTPSGRFSACPAGLDSQSQASQSGYDKLGKGIEDKGHSLGIFTVLILEHFNFNKPKVIALIAKHIRKITPMTAFITTFNMNLKTGHIKQITCPIKINDKITGVKIVRRMLNKKNIKSKFLNPSVTGKGLFVVRQLLSVISFIPTNLALPDPFLYSSIRTDVVYTLLYFIL